MATGDFCCPEMAFVGLLKLLKYLSLALLIRVLYSCLALHLRNAIAVVVLHSVCNIANASLLKCEPFITASTGLQSFAAFITSNHNVTELLSMSVKEKKVICTSFYPSFLHPVYQSAVSCCLLSPHSLSLHGVPSLFI